MSDLNSTANSSPTTALPAAPAEGDDAFSHLYKMSTTSAGGQEYVAINSASIAALLLGIASVLALVHGALLIVPFAGMACAIIAWVQIRGSNGTQTGRGFAIVGLALALIIGAAKIGVAASEWAQERADTRACSLLIEHLSQDVHSARYDEAYEDLFSSAFRRRVDRKAFAAVFQQFADRPDYGTISSIEWNHMTMAFGDVGSSGIRIGYAMTTFTFQRYPNAFRQAITFSTRDGSWRIDNIDFLFPQTKSDPNAGG